MNTLELKKFVEENPSLVTMKPAGDGIFVLKYKRKVFFDNLWNEYLEECRGTIVDSEFNVVSYPFKKIYNFRVESKAPVLPDETKVTAFEKINGFMVSMTWWNNDVLVSTTGSTDSDFVTMAKELMLQHMSWDEWKYALSSPNNQGVTFMFEACHKNDPHIIPEKEGLYILGYRINEWGRKVGHDPLVIEGLAKEFNCFKPQNFKTTIGELVQKTKECKIEGYVFYADNGMSSKIKSPYYLCLKAMARKKDILSLNKDRVDEEYYPLVTHLLSVKGQFNNLDEQARLEYIRSFLTK